MSYRIHKGMIPSHLCDIARHKMLLEFRQGVSVEEVADYSRTTWWPHLRYCPEVLAVRDALNVQMNHNLVWAEPQILIRLPDLATTALGDPHVDSLPPWAGDDWRYRSIYGVELQNTRLYGGVTVSHVGSKLKHLPLERGDVLEMDPDFPHSGSPNFSADVRVALFFRLLESTKPDV